MRVIWQESDGIKMATVLWDSGRQAFPPDALVDPVEPDAPVHQWVIRGGQLVADPARTEPPDPRDQARQALKRATTVAELRAALETLLG